MSEWRPIETAPATEWGKGLSVLLWSKMLGVRDGEVHHFRDHPVYASVSGFNGDAVEHWGVTHWMPLPEPPEVA